MEGLETGNYVTMHCKQRRYEWLHLGETDEESQINDRYRVRFLGLALSATSAQRDCVSQEMRRNIKHQRHIFLIQHRGSLFVLAQ